MMIERERQRVTERERELRQWQVLAKLLVSQISCGFVLMGINNEQDEQAYTHTLAHIHTHTHFL